MKSTRSIGVALLSAWMLAWLPTSAGAM